MEDKKNQIGQVIDIDSAVCREFDISEIHNYIASNVLKCMSWAFRSAKIMKKNLAYRFTVSGRHHTGHVYIVLNFMDTFDIYYTSNRGTIKKISNDVYIDQLIDILDKEIEYISDYVR